MLTARPSCSITWRINNYLIVVVSPDVGGVAGLGFCEKAMMHRWQLLINVVRLTMWQKC